MASSCKCSHGHVHDAFDPYRLMHELYGHLCNAELKTILQNKVVQDTPINIKFRPTQLPCAACLQVNTITSRVSALPAEHHRSASTTWGRSGPSDKGTRT
jgi:hypothetical protein